MDPVLLRVLLVAGGVTLVTVIGRLWQRRDGRVRDVPAGANLGIHHLDALGLDLAGASTGAVLLGSPTCAPCSQVKRVLGELQGERDGFRWVYADAADHLALVEEHGVMRVPTLFVVEPSGRILARTSGVPNTHDLRQVLDGERLDGLAA